MLIAVTSIDVCRTFLKTSQGDILTSVSLDKLCPQSLHDLKESYMWIVICFTSPVFILGYAYNSFHMLTVTSINSGINNLKPDMVITNYSWLVE